MEDSTTILFGLPDVAVERVERDDERRYGRPEPSRQRRRPRGVRLPIPGQPTPTSTVPLHPTHQPRRGPRPLKFDEPCVTAACALDWRTSRLGAGACLCVHLKSVRISRDVTLSRRHNPECVQDRRSSIRDAQTRVDYSI